VTVRDAYTPAAQPEAGGGGFLQSIAKPHARGEAKRHAQAMLYRIEPRVWPESVRK